MKVDPIKIVITGPESTGKTGIASHLAGIFQAKNIPEYARSYIEGLKRPYTYEDVEHIARMQDDEFNRASQGGEKIVLADTYLIITKIWFREVFGRTPDWIDHTLRESGIDLFLLCYYDLEWIKDPVRENPGLRRIYLYERYREEIEQLDAPFEVIRGIGPERFRNAREALIKHFPNLKTE
ncbi:AAA family ATPase [Bacteroidota bacterium]